MKKSANEVSEKEEEDLRKFMNVVFRKQIFGNILVSPTSDKYKENQVILELNELKNKILDKENKFKSLIEKHNELVNKYNKKNSANIELNEVIQSKKEQLQSLKTEIAELKNKSRIDKIIDAFK